MNKHDVIKKLGFPNKIDAVVRLKSKLWSCARCGQKVESKKPVTIPSICDCGCRSFFKRKAM